MKAFFLLLCLWLASRGSSALDWNQSVKKSGSTLYACSNDTVIFPYLFDLSESESIVSMTWTYIGKKVSNLIAQLLINDLLKTSHLFNKYTLNKNGSFSIQNTSTQDTGKYVLRIVTHNEDQNKIVYQKILSLVVSENVMYKGNKLKAKLSDKADWNFDTESFSLSLTCGDFIFKDDNAPIDVEWITPDGSVKNSTNYSDRKFYLQLDNPVKGGQYVCKIPEQSLGTVCATPNTKTKATVRVDEDKARIILLEIENKKFKAQDEKNEKLIEQGQEDRKFGKHIPIGCEDLQSLESGKRTIYSTHVQPFTIYCDQDTDGGRWNVFQRRQDGSVDFYKGWSDYRQGFGDPDKEFWLGLETLYQMINDGRTYELRFDLEKQDGSKYYAVYDDFSIGSESEGYAVNFTGYRGNAGDGFSFHKNMKFTTKDRDQDPFTNYNCAVMYLGAWWYKNCHRSNLNGHYNDNRLAKGLYWHDLTGHYTSLKKTEMKFRVKQ